MPHERNLPNPSHAAFGSLMIFRPEPQFDPRMWQKRRSLIGAQRVRWIGRVARRDGKNAATVAASATTTVPVANAPMLSIDTFSSEQSPQGRTHRKTTTNPPEPMATSRPPVPTRRMMAADEAPSAMRMPISSCAGQP